MKEKNKNPGNLPQYFSLSPEVPNQSVFFYPAFIVHLSLFVELFLGCLAVVRGEEKRKLSLCYLVPEPEASYLKTQNYCSEKESFLVIDIQYSFYNILYIFLWA